MPKSSSSAPDPKVGVLEHTLFDLSEAWDNVSHSRALDALRVFYGIGTRIINIPFEFIKENLGWDAVKVARNKNLKWYQKALRISGIALATLPGIMLAVAFVAGASALVPPFMLAGFAGVVISDVADLISDVLQYRHLQRSLISETELRKSLDSSGLNASFKKALQAYLFNQKGMFEVLYQSQKQLMTRATQDDESRAMLDSVNDMIEKVKKGEKLEIDSKDFQSFSKWAGQNPGVFHFFMDEKAVKELAILKQALLNEKDESQREKKQAILSEKELEYGTRAKETALRKMVAYDTGCAVFHSKKKVLPKRLKDQILVYQNNHNGVYAQNLPLSVKEKIINAIEKKGAFLEKQELALMHASVLNHFLNITTSEQVHSLDSDLKQSITENLLYYTPEKDMPTIEAYINGPRQIFSLLLKAKQAIPEGSDEGNAIRYELDNNWLTKDMLSLFESVDDNKEFNNLKSLVDSTNNADLKGHFDELKSVAESLQANREAYKALFEAEWPDAHHRAMLQQSIEAHRKATFLQHVASEKYAYSSVGLAGVKAQEVMAEEKQEGIFRRMGDWAIERLIGEEGLKRFQEKRKATKAHDVSTEVLSSAYEKQYAKTHEMLSKAQEMEKIRAGFPKKVINLGLDVLKLGTALVSTIALPLLFTPGAPAVAVITPIVTVASVGITALKIGNGIALSRQEAAAQAKQATAEEVKRAVGSDRKAEIHPAEKKKILKKWVTGNEKTEVKKEVGGAPHGRALKQEARIGGEGEVKEVKRQTYVPSDQKEQTGSKEKKKIPVKQSKPKHGK